MLYDHMRSDRACFIQISEHFTACQRNVPFYLYVSYANIHICVRYVFKKNDKRTAVREDIVLSADIFCYEVHGGNGEMSFYRGDEGAVVLGGRSGMVCICYGILFACQYINREIFKRFEGMEVIGVNSNLRNTVGI